MTDEKKQEFTLKITNANKSQLVVVIYDMALEYLFEAKEAFNDNDKKTFRKSLDSSQRCINSLLSGLDFDYEISHALWHLYFYANKRLSEAFKTLDISIVNEISSILTKLREAFNEVSKQDFSKPMMGNTQSVVAGMTYGKNSLNEALQNNGQHRGYFA